MQQRTLLGLNPIGFHKLAYAEWRGDSDSVPVICAHGLTRNGRDFDRLAEALQPQRTVFCPDIAGRGQSDWLPNGALYGYPQYLADINALIARTGATQVDWVGTSMGGLIGMLLAALPQSPIRRLVINDIGPFITLAALQRIGFYVGATPGFDSVEEVETHMRKIYAPFGQLSDADWRHLAAHGTRTLANGQLALNYDPAIAQSFATMTQDADFWPYYDNITCPTLALRGALSDLLSAEVAEAMTQRGPRAQLITFPDTGHAPALMAPDQIAAVREFLT